MEFPAGSQQTRRLGLLGILFSVKSAVQSFKSLCFQKAMEGICSCRNASGLLDEVNVRRILVVQLANIGDAVLATPVISALSKKFKTVAIDVLTGSENIDIFRCDPNVRKIITYNSSKYLRHGTVSNRYEFYRQFIGSSSYDVVVMVRGDVGFLSYLMFGDYAKAALSRIKNHPQRRMWLNYTGLLKTENRNIPHNVEMIFNSLRDIGIDLTAYADEKSYVRIPDSAREEAEQVLHNEGIVGEYIVFHLNTPFRFRNWPLERFIALIDHASDQCGFACVLVGGPKDEEYGRHVLSGCNKPGMVHSLIGKGKLAVTAAIFERARLYVGNDSGPMHVAAAMGTPVLGFFGPQTQELFHPWQTRTVILSSSRPCSPCWQRDCVSPENYCMMDISVEQAMLAFDEIVKDVCT